MSFFKTSADNGAKTIQDAVKCGSVVLLLSCPFTSLLPATPLSSLPLFLSLLACTPQLPPPVSLKYCRWLLFVI